MTKKKKFENVNTQYHCHDELPGAHVIKLTFVIHVPYIQPRPTCLSSVCPWIVFKTSSLKEELYEVRYLWIGLIPTLKYLTRPKRRTKDKHLSLFVRSVDEEEESFL